MEYHFQPIDDEIRMAYNLIVVPRDETWLISEEQRLQESLLRVQEEIDFSNTESSKTPEVNPEPAKADSGNGSGATAQEPNVHDKEESDLSRFDLLVEIFSDTSLSDEERFDKMVEVF